MGIWDLRTMIGQLLKRPIVKASVRVFFSLSLSVCVYFYVLAPDRFRSRLWR